MTDEAMTAVENCERKLRLRTEQVEEMYASGDEDREDDFAVAVNASDLRELLILARQSVGVEEIVAFLRDEAACARQVQGAETATATDKLYRMGQKDGLLLAAEAIERGALSRLTGGPSPPAV